MVTRDNLPPTWITVEPHAMCVVLWPPPATSHTKPPTTHAAFYTRSRNALSGTLAPELGATWPLMGELVISMNSLSGPLPQTWVKMGRLKFLYLL